jgi:dTDP-4-dehydrorhamnose 3,5-epimerase-like enzyme
VAPTSDLFIQGVTFEPKPIFADARGDVRQFVTAGANGRIGEVYFSTVWPGVIKGYHLHKRMTLRYTCVVGVVLVGLADARPASPTFGRTMVWRLAEGGGEGAREMVDVGKTAAAGHRLDRLLAVQEVLARVFQPQTSQPPIRFRPNWHR